MTFPAGQSQAADPSTCTSDFRPDALARMAISAHYADQLPDELAFVLAYLATEARPRLVLELGTWRGGLAWALLSLPSAPLVVSVSLPDSPGRAAGLPHHPNHHVIWADTQQDATLDQVRYWADRGPVDVLVIDADHTYQAASADWNRYAPLVRPGGLVLMHDIADAVRFPDVQVSKLWREIRQTHRTLAVVADPDGLAGFGIVWV